MGIVGRLRRRFESNRAEAARECLGTGVHGALGNDDQIAGLDVVHGVAERELARAGDDVLDLVRVSVEVFGDVAALHGNRRAIRHGEIPRTQIGSRTNLADVAFG